LGCIENPGSLLHSIKLMSVAITLLSGMDATGYSTTRSASIQVYPAAFFFFLNRAVNFCEMLFVSATLIMRMSFYLCKAISLLPHQYKFLPSRFLSWITTFQNHAE